MGARTQRGTRDQRPGGEGGGGDDVGVEGGRGHGACRQAPRRQPLRQRLRVSRPWAPDHDVSQQKGAGVTFGQRGGDAAAAQQHQPRAVRPCQVTRRQHGGGGGAPVGQLAAIEQRHRHPVTGAAQKVGGVDCRRAPCRITRVDLHDLHAGEAIRPPGRHQQQRAIRPYRMAMSQRRFAALTEHGGDGVYQRRPGQGGRHGLAVEHWEGGNGHGCPFCRQMWRKLVASFPEAGIAGLIAAHGSGNID